MKTVGKFMGSTIHEIEDSPVYYPLILTKPQWYILQQMIKSWLGDCEHLSRNITQQSLCGSPDGSTKPVTQVSHNYKRCERRCGKKFSPVKSKKTKKNEQNCGAGQGEK
jgi:hypothetical protein